MRRWSGSRADSLQPLPGPADIRHISEPDLAMTRAILPIGRAALLVFGLTAAAAAVAGGAREGDRRASNTFCLVTVAPSPQSQVVVPSNGTGVGPSKPVVSNPYNVPLLQNAGSIHSLR
jgi:hypothetical protein